MVHKGFITLFVIQLGAAPGEPAEYMVRVNGAEVKKYPADLDEAKDLAVRAARKLIEMASVALQ